MTANLQFLMTTRVLWRLPPIIDFNTELQMPPTSDLSLAEREILIKEGELELKRQQAASATWSNPMVLAIFAAAVAGVGNAVALWWNGQLEDRRAEHARVLELIKTGSIKQASENLDFLVRTGLVSDATVSEKVKQYISSAKPGTGPALPPQYPIYSTGTTVPDGEWDKYAPTYNGDTTGVVVTPAAPSSATSSH